MADSPDGIWRNPPEERSWPMLRRMRMRPCRFLLALPLLLTACGGGECIDIGIPTGVSISSNEYGAAARGATVEVCAAGSCGTAPLDAAGAFIDLPLKSNEEVAVSVTIRDATARELARSEVIARPVDQQDDAACDRGDAAQVVLELDTVGKAREVR